MELFKQEHISQLGKNTDKAENVNNSEESEFDENGVHKDLWPYRDEMREWANSHADDIAAFLQYKNAKFKLIFADGFYHRPGDDTISLSVQEFKEMKESGGMTIDQIFFGFLHEIAHLKTMIELDSAGKYNHLAHFRYEEEKKIEDSNNSTKFATLRSAYRQFYNITEDAVVNSLVFDTPYFSENIGGESKKRNTEVKDFYTSKAFALHEKAENGDYAEIVDNKTGKKSIHKTEPGRGDLKKIDSQGYDEGFNWNDAVPDMNRGGQFLTYFIKNQMIGLKEGDIKSSQNPEGKHELHEDTASALSKSLIDAYEILLRKSLDKYKNDPQKLKRYIRFMSQAQRVPKFEEKNNEIVETGFDIVPNVFSPSIINKDPKERIRTINDLVGDEKKINSIVAFAKLNFRQELKKIGKEIGLRDISDFTYLDLFNEFKEVDKKKSHSWTFPLKHNLTERTKIMRVALEPIYTLLCILDDNFEVNLPPEREPGGPPPPKGPENPEKPMWKQGDKVKNNQKGSSNFGKKGVVSSVYFGGDGNVESVTVKYIEEDSKMASEIQASGDEELIYNPNENLIFITKKGAKGGQKGKEDPREKEYEDDENEGENDDENEEEDKESDDKDDDENKEGDQSDDKNENEQEQKDQDLEKIVNPYKKALEDMIEQEGREKNLKELEKSEKNLDFQEKQANKKNEKDLLEKLKKAREKKGEIKPTDSDFSDEQIVKSFIELEAKLLPYSEKMAKHWLEVINNIASKIEVVKDKYYRSGKMDIKRLQRHFGELEMGADIEHKQIYEQFIEKIETEIKPKMLRIVLAIDNSSSMSGNIDSIRMAIMLLNSSLRSFRVLFKDRIKDILGYNYDDSMDVVCDTDIYTFGKKSRHIKSFDIDNFEFLKEDNVTYPTIDTDKEKIEIMLVFQKINASEGDTLDSEMWADIIEAHEDEELKKMLQENMMTEMIFQISDGNINDESNIFIDKMRELNIMTAGMAIGSGAEASLAKRHGKENVIPANTPEEIVENFGELLKTAIQDKIEKPMIDYLDKLNK